MPANLHRPPAAARPRRIGLLGGTFDPIHRGHLQMARLAAARYRLDWVYFLPARLPWHKHAPAASFEDRYAMLALALAAAPRWQPLAVPAAPGKPTYSVHEVAWVRRRHPRARLFFLVGADAFRDIQTWKDYHRLLGLCDFIVAPRAGLTLQRMAAGLSGGLVRAFGRRELRLRHSRVYWLEGFAAGASSHAIRAGLAAAARPLDAAARRWAQARVPAAALAYLLRAGLYTAPPSTPRPRRLPFHAAPHQGSGLI